MTTDRKTPDDGPDCAACWEAIVTSARTGEPVGPSAAAHVEACPSCGAAAARARQLGIAMRVLADQIDFESASQESHLRGRQTADLLIRLARYEVWHRWARRACAASVGIAAGLAVIWTVVLGIDAGPPDHDLKPSTVRAGLEPAFVDGESELQDQGHLLDSAVASAIPVQGWIHLPPRGASAGSSVWWVVLNYGERQWRR